MKHQKKKRKSKASRKGSVSNGDVSTVSVPAESKDGKSVSTGLMEAFACVSIEQAAPAYRQANLHRKSAFDTFKNSVESMEDQSTTCSSSSGNLGSSESEAIDPRFGKKFKPKKVIAAAGTVSTVLGKDYVPKRSLGKSKGFNEESLVSKEDMEQFVCSMLEEDCELNMAVVRDVLCQCGYDINKALNFLLELSASSSVSQVDDLKEDDTFLSELADSLTEGASDSTSLSSETEHQDSLLYTERRSRNDWRVSPFTEVHLSEKDGQMEAALPQKVLESLFNMPTRKSAEHEPSTMNWRNVARKMASLGQKREFSSSASDGESREQLPVLAKGDDYQMFREAAKQHWESMKFCYQKAATAFASGQREYASYLSEKGRLHNRKAQEADLRASQDIFDARNKSIENVVTIDLHGQHVKPAMRLLKLHLLFGAYVRSVRSFRVITGCGSHGVGKSKLKHSVVNLLEREGITWTEENRGTLLVRLDRQCNFSFLDSASDSEDEQ